MVTRLICKHTALMLALGLLGLSGAWAETFKLRCEVDGKFPEAVPKVAPAQVTVELQLIGRHLYFKVLGPKYYEMRVSTLETEDFKGVNLNSDARIGARRQERSTQLETEIVIERGSMELKAHHDVALSGKTHRFKYTGKCRPA